jgi:hypothetical protein
MPHAVSRVRPQRTLSASSERSPLSNSAKSRGVQETGVAKRDAAKTREIRGPTERMTDG